MTESDAGGPSRTGRRPGKPDTRAQILAVAGEVFRREGFVGASVRGIAREAGVDQALVHRYFGTKRDLFAASIRLGFDLSKLPARIVKEGPDGIGVRMMTTVASLWESQFGQALIASIRDDPSILALMADYLKDAIVEAAVHHLGYPRREAELRAVLVESMMLGLAQGRFILRIEPLASLSREELIRCYAPAVQHLIAGDIGVRTPRHPGVGHRP